MREPWYVRALLSTAIGLGVVAGLARAQEPIPVPAPPEEIVVDPAPEPAMVAPGGVAIEPVQGPALVPAGEVPQMFALPQKPILGYRPTRLRHCYAHHNSPYCGNWQSELTFVFGSCKDFFGGPCARMPRPSKFFTLPGEGTNCPWCP